MNDIRIRYSPSKLKRYAVYLWLLPVLFFIVFGLSRLFASGYTAAALIGASFGAGVASVLLALSFSLRLRDRLNNWASMAVIGKDGIRITDEPYNFGLVRWENITGFALKKTGLFIGTRIYIVPVLKDPSAFISALTKRKRKIAKQISRYGSPASFEVTNAELSPDELLALFGSSLEKAAGDNNGNIQPR